MPRASTGNTKANGDSTGGGGGSGGGDDDRRTTDALWLFDALMNLPEPIWLDANAVAKNKGTGAAQPRKLIRQMKARYPDLSIVCGMAPPGGRAGNAGGAVKSEGDLGDEGEDDDDQETGSVGAKTQKTTSTKKAVGSAVKSKGKTAQEKSKVKSKPEEKDDAEDDGEEEDAEIVEKPAAKKAKPRKTPTVPRSSAKKTKAKVEVDDGAEDGEDGEADPIDEDGEKGDDATKGPKKGKGSKIGSRTKSTPQTDATKSQTFLKRRRSVTPEADPRSPSEASPLSVRSKPTTTKRITHSVADLDDQNGPLPTSANGGDNSPGQPPAKKQKKSTDDKGKPVNDSVRDALMKEGETHGDIEGCDAATSEEFDAWLKNEAGLED